MTWAALITIGIGAMLGAWLRWGLGLWLNHVLPTLPLGTLAANLLGGYLVGAAVALFHINVDLPPELRRSSPPASGRPDHSHDLLGGSGDADPAPRNTAGLSPPLPCICSARC
jgi:hypothetical protein